MKNHLFIGLGGQGGRTLGEIRKVMEQRKEDTKALQSQGVAVEFLAIDSSRDVRNDKRSWSNFGTDLSLQENDWLMLTPPSQGSVPELAIRPDIAPWLGAPKRVEEFLSQSKIEGANQRRRFGRLLFAYNATAIRNAIFSNKVARLTRSRPNQCAFHIFATLGGGTGSGCIVDLVAMIRNEYRDQSGIDDYPIFVYIYATNDDVNADVGYFFQNQYACLTDLNALMCDRLQPHSLGEGSTRSKFSGSEPIAQLVITTSLNSNNMRLPLETQIQIVAESCLERIYAWSTGQMSTDSQRVMTGQDILATFPGEPLTGIERSYRFAGFGMRRWEVPHTRLEELIALDLMSSGLRQALFNHWQDGRGFQDRLGAADAAGIAARVDALMNDLADIRAAGFDRDALAAKLREELSQQTEGLKRSTSNEPLDPPVVERTLKVYYESRFQLAGIDAFVQKCQSERPEEIRRAVQRLAGKLSELWLDRANPLALSRIPQILDELGSRLRAEMEATSSNAPEITRRQRVIEARRMEWDKVTWLTARVTSKRRQLVEAHARDCSMLHELDLRDRLTKLDANFIGAFLNELSTIRQLFQSTQSLVAKLLERTGHDRDLLSGELNDLHSRHSANKYEFDPSSLETFLSWMRRHQEHQSNAAHLLRKAIMAYCGQQQPLSSLAQVATNAEVSLEETLRHTAMNQARSIHDDYAGHGQGATILGGSLLDRLERRFQQDPAALAREVKEFVDRAAACLNLRNDTQPVTILGSGKNVSTMPKRSLLLGLPQHAYRDTVADAFRAARSAGANYHFDTYPHDDPSQIRLLLVDYWLAARFASVVHGLAERYQETTSNRQAGDARYFCNLDTEGEEGKRPNLFLPSAEEMRIRYEGELWLGQQPDVNVVISNQDGVFLCFDDPDGRRTELLAHSMEDAQATADHGKMFKLHARLAEALTGFTADQLTALLSARSREIEAESGLTSPAYKRWERMREQLKTLAN
ncbi:hypothetical protein CKO25_11435 [Thiocapsa imhoffii]|uniref:Tubulin like n=1 Tax=Thiocapsa imhoffii TaxID=382777 RepID=A0A9X1B9F3_9GAMM|nr:tubulin-like doman-containing protein [Thiocapsa imhoffii]MBK1645243.1 hypothetical protein [Thiocapsa imhoffii]